MKNRKNQQGFGAAGVFIIILVVAVVGFAGWYVWHKQKKDNKSTSTSQTTTTTTTTSTEPAKDATPAKEYLEIKEWGVRFTLTDAAKGSYYKVRESGQYTYVDVYSSNFDKLKNKNGMECKGSLLYVVSRYSANDPRLQDETNPKPSATINGYGYAGMAANQSPPACAFLGDSSSTDQAVLDAFSAYKAGLTESFKSVEAAK